MRNPPPCLRRRYDAIDELVRELDATLPAASDEQEDSPELRLLCRFWNILKDEQDSDMMATVQSNLDAPRPTAASSFRQKMQCYMSDCSKRAKKESSKEMSDRIKSTCCSKPSPRASAASSSGGCCSPRSPRASAAASALSAYSADNKEPLAKALVNLKQAATVHKKCNEQVAELLSSEKQLLEQIVHLEHREKDGLKLLKEVECMWNCMEDGYKKKIGQSLEKQKAISVQLKDIEQSSSKWRKNMKDLEFQFNNLYKCEQEIKDKINQKESDIKCIDAEIVALNKRVDTTKKETEYIKKCSGPKKKATDNIISNLNASMKKIESSIYEEKRLKETKKKEGEKYIKEARNDLTNIKKALELKTAENDDLLATKEALLQEVDYLSKSNTEWTQKSRTRHKDVAAEIYKLEKEIAAFKLRCVQCHQCVDTAEVRRFCSDCPRCAETRECINSKDSTFCVADPKNDCVCLTVKRAFIDNVFDNMYNVLSRHAKGKAGKAVANIIMNCLKRSTNGKLDSAARHAIQTFILKTIKRNLNLTIIGGAVKTRCEMDQDTYSKLLLCLKKVTPTVVNKTDHGTDSRKAPCRRFGGTGECHCPKGPSFCICGRKAPEPIPDPTSCPPTKKAPIPSDAMACPRFSSSGLEPAGGPSADQMLSWRPAPCQARTCKHPGPSRGASPPRGCDPARCSSALVPGVMPTDSTPGMLVIKTGCACGNTPCTCPNQPSQDSEQEVRYLTKSPVDEDAFPEVPATQVMWLELDEGADSRELSQTQLDTVCGLKYERTSEAKNVFTKSEQREQQFTIMCSDDITFPRNLKVLYN